MLLTPLCFSTNLIFGRGVIGEVAPFTLALLRWSAVALALSPFLLREWESVTRLVAGAAPKLLVAGFLGMWICGGLVYVALGYTTATNGTLIYTTSPVFILLIEALTRGRPVSGREIVGSVLALAGVVLIVLRGEPTKLLVLDLNPGDLLFVVAAIAWAAYSVVLKGKPFAGIPNLALLSIVAAAGALLLLPVAMVEYATGGALPATREAWGGLAGIILFASLLAFLGFQFGVRRLGPSVAGIFMYLLPAYGVLLAVIFLGEAFHAYHALGIVLVLGGVIIATLPARQPARA